MQDTADISHECLVLSEEPKKNKVTEIIGLVHLEHLNIEEIKSVITLISNSKDRFHIPGEKLTSTHVLHQIRTTDDQPINTRQYRFSMRDKSSSIIESYQIISYKKFTIHNSLHI